MLAIAPELQEILNTIKFFDMKTLIIIFAT